jgi:hypothetical protein
VASQRDDTAAVEEFKVSVAYLPASDQVERVIAKLAELNPQFHGKHRYSVEDDRVTELSFSAARVARIWPVAGLRDLQKLICSGDAENRQPSNLADLSALQSLALQELDFSWTKVASLQPLRDMSLRVLRCAMTQVSDLTPLKGMLLAELDCSATPVKDLAPLQGMPLAALNCAGTKVSTLAPLRDMPLKSLRCDPRLLREADVLRSLKQLEEINGRSPDFLHRLKPPENPRKP